jgi:FG-GAP repeat
VEDNTMKHAIRLLLTLVLSFSLLAAPRKADFNGDGFGDLAVGVPLEDDGAIADSGGINISYGNLAGLPTGSDYWDQTLIGIAGVVNQPGDLFGRSLAWGDFNGDGFDDIAVGVPGKNGNTGSVIVVHGSAVAGIDPFGAVPPQVWHQNIFGVPEVADPGDRCGWSVTAGDFDGDGFDDLAFGCPTESFVAAGEGVAIALYGTPFGLTAFAAQLWHQDIAGMLDVAEPADHFAASLTTGDFDGDGNDDLALGVPQEDIMAIADAGAVNVIYGMAAAGLNVAGNDFGHQGLGGILGAAVAGDAFATAVAAGDFNADGFDDLALGVPFDDGVAVVDAGAVNVLFGAAGGITLFGNQLWHQNSGIVSDGAENFDNFGQALATGDFDGDGDIDLAIGVPAEDVGATADAGAVNLILGNPAGGLGIAGSQFWDQNSSLDVAENADVYGATLVAGDFNGDGFDDLAGGAPKEDSVLGVLDAGAFVVFNGDPVGLTAIGSQYHEQSGLGPNGLPEALDGCGGGTYGP